MKFNDGANVEAIVPLDPDRAEEPACGFFPRGRRPDRGSAQSRLLHGPDHAGQACRPQGRAARRMASRSRSSVATLTDDKEPGVNQGMGRFEFTPVAGREYKLPIESPMGIDEPVDLPDAPLKMACAAGGRRSDHRPAVPQGPGAQRQAEEPARRRFVPGPARRLGHPEGRTKLAYRLQPVFRTQKTG